MPRKCDVIFDSPSSWFPSTQTTSILFLGLDNFLMYDKNLQCSLSRRLKSRSSKMSPKSINRLNLYFSRVSLASVGLATSEPRWISDKIIVSISVMLCLAIFCVSVTISNIILEYQFNKLPVLNCKRPVNKLLTLIICRVLLWYRVSILL